MTTETLNTISNKKALIKYFKTHSNEYDLNRNHSCIYTTCKNKLQTMHNRYRCKHINYFIIPLEQYEPNTLTVIRYTKCEFCKCIHKLYIIQFEIGTKPTNFLLSQKALTALRTGVNHEKFEEFLKNDNLYIQMKWINTTWEQQNNGIQLIRFNDD